MSKKIIGLLVAVAIIVGGLAFWGGIAYAKKGNNSRTMNMSFGGQGRGGTGTSVRIQGSGFGGGFQGGEIIAKDDTSMTVQGRDGSSKIIFFTAATPVMKMVAGQASDLKVGENVSVTGTANSDGSQSAQSIQIRPAGADTVSR